MKTARLLFGICFLLAFAATGCKETKTTPPPDDNDEQVGQQQAGATVNVPKTDRSEIHFSEVTQQSGVVFTNRNGEQEGHFSIVESLGAGVGMIDIDGDGRDDIMLPGGGTMKEVTPGALPSAVYRNVGELKFTDVTEPAGLNLPGHYSHGIACEDFDNDGFTDALVTGYGGLQLFHNLGDGTFEEVALSAGLNDAAWSSTAAWADINGDGTPDLYVAHYVDWSKDKHPFCAGPEQGKREVCPPREFEGLPDLLYISAVDGTFADKSEDFGLVRDGKGLGVLIADLNHDRRPDIYVTNDTVPNVLYQNTDGSSLDDVSLISGTSLSDRGVPDGSMGVHLMDFDQNGEFDIWVANYESESSAVYSGSGNMLFRHISNRSGVTAVGAAFVGWGTLCFDADHDGDEDVLVSNGHVIRYPRAAPLKQKPLFFENMNGQRFRSVGDEAGDYIASPHMARGSAYSDLDYDGDLDVVVIHTEEPVSILQNDIDDGRAIAVRLVGTKSARHPVGAVVVASVGDRQIMRQIIGGGSYASTGTSVLHFGVGDSDRIEALEIRWPSGLTETIEGVTVGERIVAVEGQGAIR